MVMCRRTSICRNEPSAEGFFYFMVPINLLEELSGDRKKDYSVYSGPQVNSYRLGHGVRISNS